MQLIETLHNIVCLQYLDVRRAPYGNGTMELYNG